MASRKSTTVVGVFHDREQAQQAVNELRRAGFRESQIGVAARDGEEVTGATRMDAEENNAAEGALAGIAAGAGVGTLWGIGIVAGLLPAIGPAIAGGTLAAVLSSAAVGAAAAGLAGALIGLGIPEEEAKYYEEEFKKGHVIVTVRTERRVAEARDILNRFGGYDRNTHQKTRATTSRTSSRTTTRTAAASTENTTVPVCEEELEVHKRPVKTCDVKVRKEVHTEPRTVEVPVAREEVVVERHPVAGRRTADANIASKSEEIRVPVLEEEVHVEKRPVVKEEVTVGKRKMQDTRRVSGTVRKESVRVEKDCDTRRRR